MRRAVICVSRATEAQLGIHLSSSVVWCILCWMDETLAASAEIIWDWLPLNDALDASDVIFVFGSDSMKVPMHALKLFRNGIAPVVVVSGGFGRLSGTNQKPEADIFASVLMSNGVPEESIVIENKSSNTGENISFSKRLLGELDTVHGTGVAITTPLLSRRQKATLQKQWPEIQWRIDTYTPDTVTERLAGDDPEEFLHLIVGEIDRLVTYPGKGFMMPVDIPPEVLEAKAKLATAGYDKHSV